MRRGERKDEGRVDVDTATTVQVGFQARVAWDAIKGHKTGNELASTSGVHPTTVYFGSHL
jgi:hypothetical protein